MRAYSRPVQRRLHSVFDSLSVEPSVSLPRALGAAGYRAFRRLMANPRIHEQQPFFPVFQATAERAGRFGWVLAIHDTTEFHWSRRKPLPGLHRFSATNVGFFAHLSLLALPDGERTLLGPIELQTWWRPGPKAKDQTPRERYAADDKQSWRWCRGIAATESRLAGGPAVIHLMDREADDYALLCALTTFGAHFVQRLRQSRLLAEPPPQAPKARKVHEVFENARVVQRWVPVSERVHRPHRPLSQYPPRRERLASLAFRACRLKLKRPGYVPDSLPASVEVNVVRVHEVSSPDGEEPIEWFLLTTEPITTPAQVERVVDLYRRRWLIEEFFKALKTGCGYETKQLEVYEHLLTLLALCLPLATNLLNLRAVAELDSSLPATHVLTVTEEKVLRLWFKQKRLLTVGRAMQLLAEAGGSLAPRTKAPGWQVLGRGMAALRERVEGWELAEKHLSRSRKKSDLT